MTECLYPRSTFLSEIGSQLTQGLFYEYRHQTTSTVAVYTLREHNWKGFTSMYLVYMGCESEYEASQKLLGSWTHWKKLCECSWFKPYIESWRSEMEIREASIGKAVLIEKALEGNVSAAKELMNQVYKKKGAGRPSKKELESQRGRSSMVDQRVISILDRVSNV